MNIPLAILGAVVIVVGIIFIKTSIKSYKNKDTFGSVIRSLIGGVGLVLIGIIVIVKAFNR